jgi:glycosyltransferase involved in cell wall biosynthesis
LPLRIIFIGRFDLGQKRQDLLIAALPLLTIKFHCTLVGGGGSDLPQIESLVKGPRSDIEIRKSAQTLSLLSQQDVLCLFSWFEAMPWVIQEAMMMSIPCVVSPLPEIQMLCGDSVLYADSAPEVATALNSLADAEIWRAYSQKASSRWDFALRHFFDTKRLALEMLEPNRRNFNVT